MNKKYIFTAFSVILLSVGAVYLAFLRKPAADDSEIPVILSDAKDRIGYFASHGWEVAEISEKNIVIPCEFSEAYEEYVAVQDKQGLPLRKCSGKNAVLYTYEVKNYHPNNEKILAELIVCEKRAAASIIYSEECGRIISPVV